MANINGKTMPVQVDVKTTHPDGSAKTAVLTLARPDLAPGTSLPVELSVAPAPAQPALDIRAAMAAHDLSVMLSSAAGKTTQVDVLAALDQAIAAGTASFWQEGPLATQARVEIPLEGTQRLVFDVTVFQGGGLGVEAQFNNDRAMEAGGGRVAYDVQVQLNGQVVVQESLDQALYQNWHTSFSSNGRDGGQGLGSPSEGWLNIRQDIARFQEAGAVAKYDLTNGAAESLLNALLRETQAPEWGTPFSTQGVETYMPMTGGRADIGFTTASNTAWLVSQDARAAAHAMGQAEASGAAPWNMWDAKAGTWLGTDAYPHLWTDIRGGTGTPGDATSRGLTQQSDAAHWTVEAAHQPDLSYVPYLMTGQRWMLDNLQAQASWNIMSHWPDAREGDADLVMPAAQVRAGAWAIRQLDLASWISPDGSPEKAAFQEASDANWAWLVEQIPAWTALQGEAHGYVMGEYGTKGALPPWQQDYFASTTIAAAARGNADAMTFLEWQSNFLVGRFQQGANGFHPHDGAAYLIAVSDPVTGAPFKTWAEIGAKTREWGWSNGDGWSQSNGDYAQLALATLAAIANLTGSAAAADAYWAIMADNPPFATEADYMGNPTYALAPPPQDGMPAQPNLPPVLVAPPPLPDPALPDPVVPSPVTPDPVVPDQVVLEPVLPKPLQPGADTRTVSVVLSGDSWQGSPEATVFVNGVVAYHGFITAPHGQGTAIVLGDFAAAEDAVVTVRFTGDLWGGSIDKDRNLYVDDILLDGVSTGSRAALLHDGDAVFNLSAKAAPPPGVTLPPHAAIVMPELPPPAFVAAVATLGDGADVLRVGLSGDAFQGKAKYVVLVDGQRIGNVARVEALRDKGDVEFLDIRGDFGAGFHQVTIRYINDHGGNEPGKDRNLHVETLAFNGDDLGLAASLYINGDATFNFVSITPPPPPAPPPARVILTLGDGGDVLRVGLSGDAFEGKAKYVVMLDGQRIGKVERVEALRSHDDIEYLEIRGDFEGSNRELSVSYINDHGGATPGRDRNLHVESLEFNGEDLGMKMSLYTNGDALFSF